MHGVCENRGMSRYADAGSRMQVAITETRVLTAKQVREYLGVSRATVDRLLASGDLPSFTVRGARRVRRGDLESFIEQRMEPVAPRHDVVDGRPR